MVKYLILLMFCLTSKANLVFDIDRALELSGHYKGECFMYTGFCEINLNFVNEHGDLGVADYSVDDGLFAGYYFGEDVQFNYGKGRLESVSISPDQNPHLILSITWQEDGKHIASIFHKDIGHLGSITKKSEYNPNILETL